MAMAMGVEKKQYFINGRRKESEREQAALVRAVLRDIDSNNKYYDYE
jgi:hypothetical protein